MAEPGLSEYVTLNQRRRQGALRDNIRNNNYLIRAMEEHEGFESYSGGRTIVEEMSFDENGTFQRYSNAQVLNTSLNFTMTSAEFAHKQFAGAFVLSGLEERINGGGEGVIDIVASRQKILETTLKNNFQTDMISDGTADSGLQIGGLKHIVSKTPTNTVGGINRSTSAGAFWANFDFDTVNDTTDPAPGGVATSAATIKSYYNYMINMLTRDSEGPTFILAGQTHYQYLQDALFAMQRVTDERRKIKAGAPMLEYLGIPVAMAGGVNFGGQTQVQTDLSYFLNTRYLKMRYHKDAFMEPLPEVHSINQDALCKLMIFMGNMTCSNSRLQGVMYDS